MLLAGGLPLKSVGQSLGPGASLRALRAGPTSQRRALTCERALGQSWGLGIEIVRRRRRRKRSEMATCKCLCWPVSAAEVRPLCTWALFCTSPARVNFFPITPSLSLGDWARRRPQKVPMGPLLGGWSSPKRVWLARAHCARPAQSGGIWSFSRGASGWSSCSFWGIELFAYCLLVVCRSCSCSCCCCCCCSCLLL